MDKARTGPAVPDWVAYPEREWERVTPEQAGFDAAKFEALLAGSRLQGAAFGGVAHGPDDWGCVLARGGYLVRSWGNPDYRQQTASLGKVFTRAAAGLAVDDGLIGRDDPICETWTGEGQLSHPHKHLDRGHHTLLTWRLPLDHRGGFPVTNGYYWRLGTGTGISPYPGWASPTGDPSYDNCAHVEPGTQESYSSGGYWRLAQALTALWQQDIKQVLDERLFDHLGIPSDRWDWTPGMTAHDDKDWYPDMPGYGDFIDPPYEIDGHVVRGGPGWVVMSANDFARFGLLVATGGMWQGKRLISREWIRGNHAVGGHLATGDGDTCISIGKVATDGFPPTDALKELIAGPVAAAAPHD